MQVRIGELEEWKKENKIIIEDRDAQCEVAPQHYPSMHGNPVILHFPLTFVHPFVLPSPAEFFRLWRLKLSGSRRFKRCRDKNKKPPLWPPITRKFTP